MEHCLCSQTTNIYQRCICNWHYIARLKIMSGLKMYESTKRINNEWPIPTQTDYMNEPQLVRSVYF